MDIKIVLENESHLLKMLHDKNTSIILMADEIKRLAEECAEQKAHSESLYNELMELKEKDNNNE